MTTPRILLTSVGALLAASLTHAATLISWETGGIAGGGASPTTLASDFNAANILAANLTAGVGLTAFNPNDAGRFQFTSWDTSGVLADAMTAGDYIEFTIAAEAGFQFTLNTMNVYWRNRAGGTLAYDLVLASSHNGYATAVATMSVPAGNAQQSFTGVDISSIAGTFTSVTLRLAVLGVDSTGRPIALTGNGSGPELLIDGTVTAIPEPSAFAALAGFFALGLAATRRRLRQG